MKVLTATDSDTREELASEFDEVEEASLEDLAPEVVGGRADVKVGGEPAAGFDAAYLEIPSRNAVFGRVLLEMLEEKGVRVNHPSTAFFVMAKKNYLYHVLHQRGVPAPKTVSVATEKAARNVEKHLKGPLVARRLEELEETERKKLDKVEEIQEFAEGSEYEEDLLLFHEYSNGGKYRCLVAGDSLVSLEDGSDGWRFDSDSLKYSNLSDEQEEVVRKSVNAIGTPVAEVVLRGNKVFDVNHDPDLGLYAETSGKNLYRSVAEVLRGEEG